MFNIFPLNEKNTREKKSYPVFSCIYDAQVAEWWRH